MVNQTDVASNLIGSDECQKEELFGNETISFLPKGTGKFLWNPYTQGVLLGAINYGFVCTQIFGGILSEKFGSKWVTGGGILFCAIFSSLTPMAAEFGVAAIFAVRVALGMAQGVIIPSLYTLISLWTPTHERHLAVILIALSSTVGSSCGTITTGYLCDSAFLGGWPASFYVPSIAVGIFMIFWAFFVQSSPEENCSITKEEILFIRNIDDLGLTRNASSSHSIPWCSLLTSGPFLALAVLRFSHGWYMFTNSTAIPMYLSIVLGFSVVETGLLNGIMYGFSTLGTLSGLLSDVLRRKTNLSITAIRKLYIFMAYGGTATCWICVPFAGCNYDVTVTLLLVAQFFYSVSYAGDSVVIVDLAPRFAGTLYGITHTIGASCGFLSPMLTGYITENNVSIHQWSYVFFTCSAVCLIGLVCFLIWGSAEVQPWAKREKYNGKINQDSIYSDYGSMKFTNDLDDI